MTTSASTQSQGRIQLMETGIPGFDEIVGGGLPKHSLYLIQGLAGSGKTTLACQMGFAHAKKGEKVLILTLIAESHAKMINHVSNFSFYDETLIGNQIMFHGAYPSLARGGLRELLKLITASLSEQKPSILLVDGFRSIRNSSPSDLDLSEFMHSLNSLVASMGCTTFLLSPIEGNIPDSENTLVDGLIELSQYEQGMRLVREVKVFKMRGANHLLGKHAFAVRPEGIVMYPRLETIVGKKNAPPAATGNYISTGILSLDRVVGGGIVQASVTNLLGSPGVGKTSMGLHFIDQGLKNGEPGLIVGFYESPQRLIEKARRIGIDLATPVARGQLEIMWQLPLEVLPDELASCILDTVRQRGVRRLFIDGVEGIRQICMHPGRAPSFMIALLNELRVKDVTTFVTEQLNYITDPGRGNDSSASALYENILLLEFVEHNDAHLRQMSVMKLRENGYDNANHLVIISDQGVTIDGYISDIKSGKQADQPQ
ncbi:ATPase domain-containing protein [Oxalicibacterium faecigallinarum]|uniref:non-specific serine/threonine protein kinase n=1 Tax=Oxalicibacterium faecigallinarum TaxID=573741 RepID=A0A8J3F2M5_9BURK|nr:ATPase domain-containing protein [Oxalicibacterium faecigallinarum]GGI21638.1 circadian clock protein KaiC [Oxalicibacterium faecigallinarum]